MKECRILSNAFPVSIEMIKDKAGDKITISKRDLNSHIHGSIIHNNQDMETTCVHQEMNTKRKRSVYV